MSHAPEPDPEVVCARIVDDVIELLGRGQAKSTVLLGYQEKWMQAGASLETCKVVRLLVASLGAPRQGQANSSAGEVLASWLRFAMAELAAGDWDISGDLPGSLLKGGAESPLALIMKGGGVKGLAYVGALKQLSGSYQFNWFVGTSAGAVTAVLLGAGFVGDELEAILKNKNFKDFFDAPKWKWLFNFIAYRGFHPADTFTEWLDTLLAKKLAKPSRVMLSDLPFRVTVYASQRNASAVRFDKFENDVAAAYAARCSMSIPFVFIPQSSQGLRAFDGGLRHNYPVDDLLSHHPGTSFISLYLGPEIYEPIRERSVLLDVISIFTEAGDAEAIIKHRERTVIIDPRPIQTLDFGLTDLEKDFLLASGKAGALAHLSRGSEGHMEAQRTRDVLKLEVEVTRKAKRTRRRAWWLFAFAVLHLLLAISFLYSKSRSRVSPFLEKKADALPKATDGKKTPNIHHDGADQKNTDTTELIQALFRLAVSDQVKVRRELEKYIQEHKADMDEKAKLRSELEAALSKLPEIETKPDSIMEADRSKLLKNMVDIPTTNLTIPVYFHIIHDGENGKLTKIDVDNQINVFNSYLNLYGFLFELKGVDWIDNKSWFVGMGQQTQTDKIVNMKLGKNLHSSLNIYTAASQSNLIHYGSFPWNKNDQLNGIFIHHSTLPGGSLIEFNQGKTAIHAFGHWLGLYHTFEGDCGSPGDYVDDTPPIPSPTFGCVELGSRESCKPGVFALTNNFMDYASDNCMNSFTKGQVRRMMENVALYRPSLLSH